jgi:hypothetical protein
MDMKLVNRQKNAQVYEDKLSRREMQRLLKTAGLKATGTNEELERRIEEHARRVREVG